MEAIKRWAIWSTSASLHDSTRWQFQLEAMSKDDLADMLSFLAGYLVQTVEGRIIIEKLAC